jgi:hypothetical protein
MALDRMASEINYFVVLWHSRRSALAEERLRDLIPRMEQSMGADHPASGRVRSILGRVILERGDPDMALRFIENSLPGLIPTWRAEATLWLAETNLARGNATAIKGFDPRHAIRKWVRRCGSRCLAGLD